MMPKNGWYYGFLFILRNCRNNFAVETFVLCVYTILQELRNNSHIYRKRAIGIEWKRKGVHDLGIYLDSKTGYTLYKNEMAKPYFVDKTKILEELIPLICEGSSYICVTRPRRFGKTVMANMIAAYFSRKCDAKELFDNLYISTTESYEQHLNQYAVIHISFNDVTADCASYDSYISRIERKLIRDLKRAYPMTEMEEAESLVDILSDIYAEEEACQFIFVLDEWDYIFHQDFATEMDKKRYLTFLCSLLKDRPYVKFAYMTGILPIAKYSSGSELNMFAEYTMAGEERFSEYFGFTEREVDALYERYQKKNGNLRRVSREGLRQWYDGYNTQAGERLYNPRSVVMALSNNNLGNYWTSSGPYDEIYYYISNNVAEVREDLARMIAGECIPVKIYEYAATSQNLKTKEEIFSAMVVYGFLNYDKGKVSVPNRELMERFSDMLRKEPSLGYIYRLARESDKMLKATLNGDIDTMCQLLEKAHDTEIPLLSYNHESDLTAVVNLLYLAARDEYRVEREDKAGVGYVDFIFYPETDRSACGIILELKVDHTPEEAIEQIKEKKYALKFQGKLGEVPRYTGKVLAVGIGYDRKTKKHSCKVAELKK